MRGGGVYYSTGRQVARDLYTTGGREEALLFALC